MAEKTMFHHWLMAAGLLLVTTFGPLMSRAQELVRDPIAGPWEQIEAKILTTGITTPPPNPPLHLIYSDGHFVQFTAAAGRSKTQTPREQMTREQLLERYDMQGQYGTYRIEGNKLIRRAISAANPTNEGVEVSSEFRIEGDTLITTGVNVGGNRFENRYRRLR
jgi:hypothetical protein